MNTTNSVTTGTPLAVGALRIPSTTLTDLGRYTLAQTELLCPATRLPHTFDQGTPGDPSDDIAAHLTFPRWLVLKQQFERVRVACATPVPGTCGNGVVDGGEQCDTGIPLGEPGACETVTVAIDEDLDGNGTPETSVTYEVFSGIGLACADRAYRPFLLHPTTGPEATSSPETFGTFFRYLCLQSWDEAQGKAVYRCGKGLLAAGVSGYAVRDGTLSARPIYLSSLTWGRRQRLEPPLAVSRAPHRLDPRAHRRRPADRLRARRRLGPQPARHAPGRREQGARLPGGPRAQDRHQPHRRHRQPLQPGQCHRRPRLRHARAQPVRARLPQRPRPGLHRRPRAGDAAQPQRRRLVPGRLHLGARLGPAHAAHPAGRELPGLRHRRRRAADPHGPQPRRRHPSPLPQLRHLRARQELLRRALRFGGFPRLRGQGRWRHLVLGVQLRGSTRARQR
ncbi:MAG: hypothetical protein IPF74_16910 [Rhodocyclaceae bacterium]|nr:hypothetical protein [Rhodocyclaceae bacterium]